MTIAQDLSGLVHSAIVELLELDATEQGGSVFTFHAGTNELKQPVVWKGVTYQPFPIEVAGFDQVASGPMPRPTLRVSNVLGLVGTLVRSYNGLRGAKLTRRRTLAKYLDAVNFAAGNAFADPLAAWADEIWYIDRAAERDGLQVIFELQSPLDVAGKLLPGRQVTQRYCPLVYRGTDPTTQCPYTGPAVAKADDTPTSLLAEDKCSKKISGCKLRNHPNGELPFGGFPGAGTLRAL